MTLIAIAGAARASHLPVGRGCRRARSRGPAREGSSNVAARAGAHHSEEYFSDGRGGARADGHEYQHAPAGPGATAPPRIVRVSRMRRSRTEVVLYSLD